MNTFVRAMMMPLWEDCPWDLPAGVIPKRDGNTVVLMAGPKSVGLLLPSFDVKNLPEILSRLGLKVNA